MLVDLSDFPGVAESVCRSTIIDVRAGKASVIGVTAEITRIGLGYRVVVPAPVGREGLVIEGKR